MTDTRLHGFWARVASLLLISACGGSSDSDAKEERATAHVLPLQSVSLQGFLPAGAEGGLIRFEADHFAYELPLTTIAPASVLAPIYVAPDGTLGSGTVSLFWVPSSDESEGDGGTSKRPANYTPRPPNAVDLGIDLTVGALPRFAYAQEQPGVLLHAFLTGTLEFQEVAYRDAIASAAPAAQAQLTKMRDDSIASLKASLELIESVRRGGDAESMGEISFEGTETEVGLSRASLTIADQLVAAFLIATRTGPWQSHVGTSANVAELRQALFGDLAAEAREWLPNMTDEISSGVLEHGSRLSSVIGHATMAVGIMGALGVVAAPTALAATAIGAVAFFAVTYAPAATAAVIRAAGNLVRGGGSLNGYEYDSVAPSLKYVLTQNLSYCLGLVQDKVVDKIAGVSKGAAILTQLASAVGGFIDDTSASVSSWLVDCAADRSLCIPKDASDAGAGGNGNGNGGDGGPSVGTCNEAQTAGGDTPESRTFDVGTNCADLTLAYDTVSVEDEITVSYEGQVVAGTGCVGASSSLSFNICGTSSEVLVEVVPNCAGGSGTAWSFTLQCP